MSSKRDSRGRSRDYKKEYKRDHKSDKDKKDRSSRNAARAKLKKWHQARGTRLAANKDVDHKDGNPRNNSPGNLRAESAGTNRARENRKRAKSYTA